MPRFEIRLTLPDRPGALGVVAVALGRAGVNIINFDVVEALGEVAVDQLVVEAAPGEDVRLRQLLEALPGVHVEDTHPIPRRPSFTSPLDLVEDLTTGPPGQALQMLVDGLPMALRATWASALRPRDPHPEPLGASVGAPSLVGMRTPWLPLPAAAALPPSSWAPARWALAPDEAAIAAAPLDAADAVVFVVRKRGPAFRPSEVRQLATLTRVAARLGQETVSDPAHTRSG